MPLKDPVAVYNAANNIEAHLIKIQLTDAEIEAFVSEDLSTAGIWAFGLLPEIHKPQVWIDRGDMERAKPVLEAYEAKEDERRAMSRKSNLQESAPIEVLCEECGKSVLFSPAQIGSVQDCPACGAYVDVGDSGETDQYWREGEEDAAP